jgi:hypothetical protein
MEALIEETDHHDYTYIEQQSSSEEQMDYDDDDHAAR